MAEFTITEHFQKLISGMRVFDHLIKMKIIYLFIIYKALFIRQKSAHSLMQ